MVKNDRIFIAVMCTFWGAIPYFPQKVHDWRPDRELERNWEGCCIAQFLIEMPGAAFISVRHSVRYFVIYLKRYFVHLADVPSPSAGLCWF